MCAEGGRFKRPSEVAQLDAIGLRKVPLGSANTYQVISRGRILQSAPQPRIYWKTVYHIQLINIVSKPNQTFHNSDVVWNLEPTQRHLVSER